MRRLIRSDSNKRGEKLTLKRRLTLERLENRSLFAGFPIGIGGTGTDIGNSIVTDNSGNVFVAGEFSGTVDFDASSGTANLTSNGTNDGFLAKYSSSGVLVWARRFGGASGDSAGSVAVDSAGNAYLVGSFLGTTGITGTGGYVYSSTLTSHNYQSKKTQTSVQDALIVKFDSAGAVAWAKQFGGSSASASAYAGSVAIDTGTNSVFITGNFSGAVDFNPDSAIVNQISAGSSDAFVVKLDSTTGSFGWSIKAGSTGNDQGLGIALDSSGNTYVTGSFEASNPFGSYIPLTSKGGKDGFVAKLNPNDGTVDWAKSFGGAGAYDGPREIRVANNSIYIAGDFTTATLGTSFGPLTLFGLGGQDGFVSKLNTTDGGFQWTKQFGGLDTQVSRSLSIGTNEDVFIGGYFYNTVDFDPGVGSYNLTAASTLSNAFVTKLDSNGNFGWAQSFGSTSNNQARSVFWDSASSLFVAGVFAGSGPFFPSNKGGSDAFVVKLDPSTGSSISSLLAAAPAPMAVSDSLSLSQVTPVFDAALAKWQATGADISSLRSADILVTNLGGSLLGLASGNTITLDDNAAGWGWFIDSTPSDDSEFLGTDNQGTMQSMDLLSVLMHEMGHILGYDHDDEGLMAETLAAGTRSVELEQVHIAATDLAFGERLDFDNEFTFVKVKRRR